MYIKEIKLSNIRSVRKLHMTFDKPAGWHVILGDNGAGKTSILRAICSGLVGPTEILRLNPGFETWVTAGESTAEISLKIERSLESDKRAIGPVSSENDGSFWCKTTVRQDTENGRTWKYLPSNGPSNIDPYLYNWSDSRQNGWFSAAFGPYRRFVGGDNSLKYIFKQNPKIGAHLTVYNEGVTLSESIVWLKDTLLNSLFKNSKKDADVIKYILILLNEGDLLPRGYALKEINADGLLFTTPTGDNIHLYELSEGLKSVTSLTLELMRLLVETFGSEKVFSNFPNDHSISSEGVVLIDEIDSHLHPSWQAKIGQWFTQCFPNIQFIVTTHSPLACRAATNGSVWYIPTVDNEGQPQKLENGDLNSLLYGDILDAFSTDYFGKNITRSDVGKEEVQLLVRLNQKYLRHQITEPEAKQRTELLKKYPFA